MNKTPPEQIEILIRCKAIRPAYKKNKRDVITHWLLNWSSAMVRRVLQIEPMRLSAEGSKTVRKDKYGFHHIPSRCAAYKRDKQGN